MSNYTAALVNGAKGRKLVIFRDAADLSYADSLFPEANLELVHNLGDFPATDVHRALDNFLKGIDGLLYCQKQWRGR